MGRRLAAVVGANCVLSMLSTPNYQHLQGRRVQEGQKMLQQAHAEKGFIHLVGK